MVYPETIPGELGGKWEYTLDGIQGTLHNTFTHSFNHILANLPTCMFWKVGGNPENLEVTHMHTKPHTELNFRTRDWTLDHCKVAVLPTVPPFALLYISKLAYYN